MKRHELKNWLAALGIGGGLAVSAHATPPKPAAPEVKKAQADPRYVVINHEEQYSIWPSSRVPAGWKDSGATCTPATCVEVIGRTPRPKPAE